MEKEQDPIGAAWRKFYREIVKWAGIEYELVVSVLSDYKEQVSITFSW